MHLSSTLSLAILSLVPSLRALNTSTHPVVSDDVECPSGYSPTFVHNTYTYNGALKEFTDIAGRSSTFSGISYVPCPPFSILARRLKRSQPSATLLNTTGADNIPGATRAGVFGGTPFNETLTAYDTRPDALFFTVHGNLPLALGAFNIVGSAETKRFQSICSGKATYIDVLTYLCSDDQTATYDLFYNIHTTAFQNLAVTIGTTVLAGDCPT
ncbi:hypothetical protein B0H13DRAFT_2361302 [Mycena leptocephala]|nr:hypothetical protein B0H13DRAFT_2361302 [Mycena leptocephala]